MQTEDPQQVLCEAVRDPVDTTSLDVIDSPVHDTPLYEKLLPSCSMSCLEAFRVLTVKLQCSGAVYVRLTCEP